MIAQLLLRLPAWRSTYAPHVDLFELAHPDGLYVVISGDNPELPAEQLELLVEALLVALDKRMRGRLTLQWTAENGRLVACRAVRARNPLLATTGELIEHDEVP